MNVVALHQATPPRSGLVVWNGIEKDTGRPVWIVDLVEPDGTVNTVGICYRHADVARYVAAWEDQDDGGAS